MGSNGLSEYEPGAVHIIDIVPTVLDALGLEPPPTIPGVTQSPMHGVSFAHTFDEAAAPTRHGTRYFEAPFRFTGTPHNVTVDLSSELIKDSEAEMRVAMARQ